MDTHKKCCFIGHRKIEISNELENQVYNYVENLIINKNVKFFLFGSKSDFNNLCHSVVDKLKNKYPNIKKIAYDCRNENSFLENEREKWEKILAKDINKPIHLLCVDEIVEYKRKYISGKNSYIERNQAMIDDSDYCLFYYNEKYTPMKNKYSNKNFCCYQTNSGTALAYKYAKHNNKSIKNFYKNKKN